jgi:predicted helicase
MLRYFQLDPALSQQYEQVWLWSDWPDSKGKPDTGIDLVARERDTGDYIAIQCKFYEPTHTLAKGDIDSFFTASSKKPFTNRVIISTTDKWGKKAKMRSVISTRQCSASAWPTSPSRPSTGRSPGRRASGTREGPG